MSMNPTGTDMWTFRDERLARTDVTGFDVEASDGAIGKVDDATNDVGNSYIVVDTGSWIFGKKVMLPGNVIDEIDLDAQKLYVRRTKDEIKNAPEFDEARITDPTYRDEYAGYYGSRASEYRDPSSLGS
jgi:hypothetical protein